MSKPTTTPHFGSEPFPRAPLYGAAVLIALALLMIGGTRLKQAGSSSQASAVESAALVERDLRFEDRDDGSIDILDASDAALVDTVAPGTNGFLRGAMRGMARERRRQNIGPQTPFHLAALQDGHLVLSDPATQRRVDLGAFGPTNLAAFAKLLPLKNLPSQARAPATTANPS